MYVFKKAYIIPQAIGITGFTALQVKCTENFTYTKKFFHENLKKTYNMGAEVKFFEKAIFKKNVHYHPGSEIFQIEKT